MTSSTRTNRPRISDLVPGYRYPRTAAELVNLRAEQFAAMPQGKRECRREEHGELVPRPLERQTYEQLFCGLWWDCPADIGCGGQFAISRDLAYDHGEPYNTGYGWEKFTPAGWVPISDEEAEAFWNDLCAWWERQQPTPKRKRGSAGRTQVARSSPGGTGQPALTT